MNEAPAEKASCVRAVKTQTEEGQAPTSLHILQVQEAQSPLLVPEETQKQHLVPIMLFHCLSSTITEAARGFSKAISDLGNQYLALKKPFYSGRCWVT